MAIANITGNILTDTGVAISTLVSGSGTTSYVPKFTGASTIGNSLIFDNGTNVGIGTTSPFAIADTNLSVNGTTSSAIQLGFNGTRYGQFYTDSGEIRLSAVANLPLTFYSNNLERMRISASGNVGIGTSSPNYLLHINSSTTAAHIQLTNSDTGSTTADGGRLFMSGLNMTLNNREAGYIAFETSDTERMRITSGGQIQIKQGANGYTDGLRIINTANNNWTIVNGGDGSLYLGYNSADRGVFNVTTGTYTATSDINKKKDFEQSNIGLNEILALKPTLYRMKTEDETTEKHLGFIAQEVKEYIPQAYSELTNGDTTFIGLTEMPIVAALVKAIQEQNQLISELSAKVSALENK